LGRCYLELADMSKDERKGFLLRLSDDQYEKLRQISANRTAQEKKHVSMQKVLEELLEEATVPTPSLTSSETAREAASSPA
jgi:hypothetical protein